MPAYQPKYTMETHFPHSPNHVDEKTFERRRVESHLLQLVAMKNSFTAQDVARMIESGELHVKHSARRKKTVTLKRSGGQWELAAPMHYDVRTDLAQIAQLLTRLSAKSGAEASDEDLLARARTLNSAYFKDDIEPQSVKWVENQNSRWASCSAVSNSIRVSHRLQAVPDWVLDAVLVHELAHLRESDHGPRFRELTERYPRSRDADIFLEGFSRGIDYESPQ